MPLAPSTFPKTNPMPSFERALSSNALWLGAAAGICLFQLTLIFTHQAWADEYQALLIATESRSASELLAALRYEGHPPLWYWFLQVISVVVPPALVLPIAAASCALLVQAIILFASPFARAERLLLCASHYILFEFMTIVRGTTLGTALVFAAAALWHRRWFWLVLAALPMVDFLFGVISIIFLVLKWRERGLWWPGIAGWLAASLFAAYSVIPASDMVSASAAMNMPRGPLIWAMMVGSLPVPFQGGIAPQWNTPVAPFWPVGIALMGWLCWRFTREFPWHRASIAGFFALTAIFSLAIYPIGLRHLMLGPLLLIALVWRQRAAGKACDPAFIFWLAVLAICGIATGAIATARGFDSAPRAIDAIEARGLMAENWVAFPEWRSPAIAGRSALEFSRLGGNCTFRHVIWNQRSADLLEPQAFERAIMGHIAQYGRSFLISDRALPALDPALIEPLEAVPKGYNGVAYHLYILGKNTKARPKDDPACNGATPQSPKSFSLGKK